MTFKQDILVYAIRTDEGYYLVPEESLKIFDGQKEIHPFPNFSMEELVEALKIKKEDIIQRNKKGMKLRLGVLDKFFEINIRTDVKYNPAVQNKKGFWTRD